MIYNTITQFQLFLMLRQCFGTGKIKLYLTDVGQEWLKNEGHFVRRICEELYGKDQIVEITAFEKTKHIIVVLRNEENTQDLSEVLTKKSVHFGDGSILKVHEPQPL